jgi:pimeloyl-ACP methyl ester carboxylesterase
MTQSWQWSFKEAFSIVRATYVDDWGRARKSRQSLLERPNIEEIKDQKVTGLIAGQGQPVIFIHGSPANAMRWSWYLKNVPEGYQFISVDRMGFGERGQDKPDLEEDCKILSDFISGYEKPVILGHSLGGAMAIRLACMHDISRLVLVAASIDPMLERFMRIQKIGNHATISWMLSRSVRHSNLEMAHLQDFMLKTENVLERIDSPINIIHAKDDYLVPYAHVAYAKKFLKNMEVTAPDTGGHSIPWHRQYLVLDAITSGDQSKRAAA